MFEDFYVYPWQGNDNNCNSFVFARALNGGRHVLVDPGHVVTPYYRERGLERLLESMRRDGLEADAIGLVILSHSHPDHCESAIFLRKSGALVALHQADEPAYTHLGGKVDVFLDEGSLEFEGNSTKLQVLHSPGHTPGHVTLYWPDRRLLIAGDCIFYRSTGRVDLPGGDARKLRQTVNKLADLEIEHLLCGHPYGHTGIISGREEVEDNFFYIRNLFY